MVALVRGIIGLTLAIIRGVISIARGGFRY